MNILEGAFPIGSVFYRVIDKLPLSRLPIAIPNELGMLPVTTISPHPQILPTAGREARLTISPSSSVTMDLPELPQESLSFPPLARNRHMATPTSHGKGNRIVRLVYPRIHSFNRVQLSFNMLPLSRPATFALSLPPLSLPSFLALSFHFTLSARHCVVCGSGELAQASSFTSPTMGSIQQPAKGLLSILHNPLFIGCTTAHLGNTRY